MSRTDESYVRVEADFPARTDQLAIVRRFVTAALRRTLMNDRDGRAVVLAVDEAISNTVTHGYSSQEGNITIRIVCDARKFSITIVDQAARYDVAAKVDAASVDVSNHVAAGKRHGLGLFIMRKVMDEVRYDFRDGQHNELTLVKYIRPGAGGEAEFGRAEAG